jgi:hypothetical protein
MEQFEIIRNEEQREKFSKVMDFIAKQPTGMTAHQIHNFVLNDIEYPTAYGKYVQAMFELSNRLNKIVDAYYNLKEEDIALRKLARDFNSESDYLERELIDIKIAKCKLKIHGIEVDLERTLRESEEFYSVFMAYPEFHSLSDDERRRLEDLQWSEKCKNMPLVFEERYGDGYLQIALGEDYKRFIEMRMKNQGLLPREILRPNSILRAQIESLDSGYSGYKSEIER